MQKTIKPMLTEGQVPIPLQITSPGIAGDVISKAQYLGLSPQQFLQGIGLMKASNNNSNDNGQAKFPGVAGKPNALRGFLEPVFDTHTAKGVRERYQPLGFNILREIEHKNPVVSAIVNTRSKQMRPFAQESKGDDEPGFRVVTRDTEHKPTHHEKAQCKDLMKWYQFTGRTDFLGAEEREDNLLDVMVKMARDYLTIDQVPIELRRDRGRKVVDFWCLDGATIWRTTQGGYRGQKQDFDPRSYVILDEALEKKIVDEKIALIPDVSKIKFVQRLNGRFVAAYTYNDMIFDCLQKRTDVRFYGYGYPPLEQAMNACTAFLFGMAYNAEAFNSSTLPKIALAFKDGNFSPEQLMDLQDMWIANFQGHYGAWRIPMLNQEVNVIDLFKSPRDMEYMKYLEFMGSLICAVMNIDSQELGLRYAQAQNVLSENQSARMNFSKDRGLNDLLGAMSEVWNKVLILTDRKIAERYKVEYTGIEPEDKEQNSKIDTESVKRDTTVNEMRAKKDMPPIEGGDVILEPTFLQNKQAAEMAQQGGMGGEGEVPGGAEDVFSESLDETMDEMFKAKMQNKRARVLLI